MSLSLSWRRWLRPPGWLALLFGAGALSVSGAETAIAEPHLGDGLMRVPQQSVKNFGEVLVWTDAGRIYFSESGREPQEIRLGETPEASRLRRLLEREAATAASPRILKHRMILVGGGGEAIHWGGAAPSANPDRAGRAPTSRSDDKTERPRTKPSRQAHNGDRMNIAGPNQQH